MIRFSIAAYPWLWPAWGSAEPPPSTWRASPQRERPARDDRVAGEEAAVVGEDRHLLVLVLHVDRHRAEGLSVPEEDDLLGPDRGHGTGRQDEPPLEALHRHAHEIAQPDPEPPAARRRALGDDGLVGARHERHRPARGLLAARRQPLDTKALEGGPAALEERCRPDLHPRPDRLEHVPDLLADRLEPKPHRAGVVEDDERGAGLDPLARTDEDLDRVPGLRAAGRRHELHLRLERSLAREEPDALDAVPLEQQRRGLDEVLGQARRLPQRRRQLRRRQPRRGELADGGDAPG
jgi:hypothetical protein